MLIPFSSLENHRRNSVAKKLKYAKKIQQYDITTQTLSENNFLTLRRKKNKNLNDSLANLFKVCLKDHLKIDFSTFSKYKPFFVTLLECTVRNTCACLKHRRICS